MLQDADIAIVGSGAAGSTAAAMLGRAGFRVVVIDPHMTYPQDFRCEKLDRSQIRLLRRTGLAEEVLGAATPVEELWIARRGGWLEKRRNQQFCIRYEDLVSRLRATIPTGATSLWAKARGISTSPDRQMVSLSSGEEIRARLIIMADGLNVGLRHLIGLERRVVSPCHSISIGFDLRPGVREKFDFPALTCYPEQASARIAYLTLFPIGPVMRANLFVYRTPDDPWLRRMRRTPHDALLEAMPSLRRLAGDFDVTGTVRIRPVDLAVTHGHRRAGIVLVGDAFATSCPAAGTGLNKVFTDVERLCNVHVPEWLATPGMGAAKIAAFYDDPVKRASDASSAAKAYSLRAMSTRTGIAWDARRSGKILALRGIGFLRQVADRLSSRRASGVRGDRLP